jgi:N-acetyl sugar amidotransferase
MDETDPDIVFDDHGVCCYCNDAATNLHKYRFTSEQEKINLKNLTLKLKSSQNGEYDSIIGLSGGVDSSYVAYLAMEMGLNPLCVHFDNGWNSDVAIKNIRRIIDVTGFDLYTYVIDWPEFRDLQRSFFMANVIDIEMLTDHAIFAALFNIRKKHKITTVLGGNNYATEHGLPRSWVWSKFDLRNIKAIQKRFGEMQINSFPTMSSFRWGLIKRFNLGGTLEKPLNHITYKKMHAMQILKKIFDWEYYGGKHYESVFTKFYQAYVLPTKFNVDKRKVHYSDLLRNGEITYDEALLELEKPLYANHELIRDMSFVLKKLGFSESEFDQIMASQPVPHECYPTDKYLMEPLIKFGKTVFGD